MSSALKILAKMRKHYRDWRIEDVITVADHFGIEYRTTGGSHYYFFHPSLYANVSVPAHRPIKAAYIRRFVQLVEDVKESKP